MDDSRWYFAYGSNMQRATMRGRRMIEPLEVRVGRLDGYALCFDIPIGGGERGVANLAFATGRAVWGVLYLLTQQQHDHLDMTEGVPSGVYRRIQVDVDAEGTIVAAETLLSERRDPLRRPSHRYHSIVVEGAREHALPPDYVASLEALELAWDEREGAVNPPGLARR
ncbi:MAG TPA: gamma-glutamylcyclotransferase [Candidatus Binatia bacterium]